MSIIFWDKLNYMKKYCNTYEKEKSYLNKKRSTPDNLKEEENEYSKESTTKLSRNENKEKNKENHHHSFSSDSSKQSRNITINLRGNSCPKPEVNISGNSPIIYYVVEKKNYFKKENQESHENNLEYSCFIEKNKNNEIYFYQYIKYNIDDNDDNIFCYRCCDINCNGLITLNYSDKNNKEKIDLISEHTISNKAHSYIKYPTYGYQIYIDFLKENNLIKCIQLLNNEIKNENCYKNLNSLINELKRNKKNVVNNIKCIKAKSDNSTVPNENEDKNKESEIEESQTEKETKNNNEIENDDENNSRKSENNSDSPKNMEESESIRDNLNDSSQNRNNISSEDKNIFSFFNSRRNKHLAYGKEVYYKKVRNDCNLSENRIKWNEYIEQKYGENISFGTVYSIKRDEKANIFYRYRPIYCLDHKNKILRYCCLEGGCEGKVLFDLKLEKFEETNEHNLSIKSHVLSNHPKSYEIMQFFHENTEINDILILREYQGPEQKETNME